MSKIRVTIADDHPVVLAGLAMLLEAEDDFDLVGQATSGPAAFEMISALRPDIAVLDISLPVIDGLTLTRRLSAVEASIGIVVLTQHDERSYLKQALDSGARGFVLKKSAASCLINAIRGVQVGGLYVDSSIAAQIFQPRARRHASAVAVSALTGREADVLKFVAKGLTARQIAIRDDVSLSTIETYKSRALQKLGIKTRADIMRYASSQGWLAAI